MQLEIITLWVSPEKMFHKICIMPCNVLRSYISCVTITIMIMLHHGLPSFPFLCLSFSLTLSIAIFHYSSLMTHSVGGRPRSGSDDHSGNASVQYQKWDCKFTGSAINSVVHPLPWPLCFPNLEKTNKLGADLKNLIISYCIIYE